MRVLHVIDKSFVGGGQTNVRNLLEGLSGLGVELDLSCRAGGPLVERVRALGIPVHPVPFDKNFRPGPARAVARIAREKKSDLVHAHGLVATFYCVLARSFFRMRVPLLYHQHGFHHHNYGRTTVGLRIQAERWVCHRVDRVIASSREDRDEIVSGGYAPTERVPLLHNGIPEPVPTPEETARVRAALPFVGEKPIVGIMARLHIQKGVDTFLRATLRVREAAPEARFVVVGTGEIEAEMHALARELGLGDVLVFTGSLPSHAVHPFFDVAVMSSRWEGLPITLLEYMAMRRAIVITGVGGCLEAVGPDEAEIVPVDDPEALAAAILRLLQDRELARRRGAAARARFEASFQLPVIAAQYLNLYQEVLAG
jgi:glycosyltransferase involved in cell wall biosynthesis